MLHRAEPEVRQHELPVRAVGLVSGFTASQQSGSRTSGMEPSMGSMAEDTVMDTTIHEPSITAGEVDMGLLDCWEINLPSCAGELAEALLACAELTEQTYPTQSQAPVSRSQERSTVLTRRAAGRGWPWPACRRRRMAGRRSRCRWWRADVVQASHRSAHDLNKQEAGVPPCR
jgi:hypothetical protein